MWTRCGLKVENEDVHELLKSHKIELIMEELQHLQEEQQKSLADDLSSDEDEVRESIPSSLIKEMYVKRGEVKLLVKNIIRTPCWQIRQCTFSIIML